MLSVCASSLIRIKLTEIHKPMYLLFRFCTVSGRHDVRMDRVYSPEEIKFIVILTVVMVVIVAIATAISVCLSKRRNNEMIDRESLTTNEYSLTSDVPEVWSVQGHYQQIVT